MIRFLCSLLALAILVGCNRAPPPPKRGKIEGKVNVNGKPVASGKIRFMAIDPNGMNVAADIKDGEFSVPAEQGPTKGKYRVEFNVPSATKRRIPNDAIPGQFIEEAPETLPPRYHRNSTMTLDYDPATAPTFDYDLRSS